MFQTTNQYFMNEHLIRRISDGFDGHFLGSQTTVWYEYELCEIEYARVEMVDFDPNETW